jgi:hypothetical protein
MLFNHPPGYQAPNANRQSLGGLAVPGSQANGITPGGNFNPNPIAQQGVFQSPGLQNSSFITPSSQQALQPPNMTQYNKSGNGNISTLLRVLLGKTK